MGDGADISTKDLGNNAVLRKVNHITADLFDQTFCSFRLREITKKFVSELHASGHVDVHVSVMLATVFVRLYQQEIYEN